MKGIMFSDELIPMVLDGSKIMTRRIMKVQPCEAWPCGIENKDGSSCKPRYNIGEVVYLKEAWAVAKCFDSLPMSKVDATPRNIWYRVDNHRIDQPGIGDVRGKWRNKLFMPGLASRCKLEITNVKAERLQEISEGDAIKEGFKSTAIMNENGDDYLGLYASEHFATLIDSINGPGTWERNDWCFVYSFRRVS